MDNTTWIQISSVSTIVIKIKYGRFVDFRYRSYAYISHKLFLNADVRVEDFKLHKHLMEDLVGVFGKNDRMLFVLCSCI